MKINDVCGNLICQKCGEEKTVKEFYRKSKYYKSCNSCSGFSKKTVYDNFVIAFDLMDSLNVED